MKEKTVFHYVCLSAGAETSRCNPVHIYLTVSPVEYSGTYFRINMHRFVLFYLSLYVFQPGLFFLEVLTRIEFRHFKTTVSALSNLLSRHEKGTFFSFKKSTAFNYSPPAPLFSRDSVIT